MAKSTVIKNGPGTVADARRTRMHRALDRALDTKRASDRDYPTLKTWTTAQLESQLPLYEDRGRRYASPAMKAEAADLARAIKAELASRKAKAPVGDAQDHPDSAVQAKVDKYRATALKQGFKPESVEKSIKQLLDEGRFKATSKVADTAFKKGDKVWANPIGKSGGTVKGVMARINASGQVVIESGGREHEFHPSNVHASDIRPVGDDEETPFEKAVALAKVGNRVTLKAGFGYHYGNNFGRLTKSVGGKIEASHGSDIYVLVDGEKQRWKFPLMAIET